MPRLAGSSAKLRPSVIFAAITTHSPAQEIATVQASGSSAAAAPGTSIGGPSVDSMVNDFARKLRSTVEALRRTTVSTTTRVSDNRRNRPVTWPVSMKSCANRTAISENRTMMEARAARSAS
jgi:hypothetical protein